ncbi:MAG: prepilin-type N-terminal cleavage/methylation domain-containing protein [Gammaproteobacteria bacterium]
MAMLADTAWRAPRNLSGNAGFSLIELAVVLTIIGTLMSGVLVAVSQSMANARITDARAQLREIEEALYGYAQATGRLPCPATDDSANAGYEESAPCDDFHGFVPAGTLGIAGPVNSDGLLVDPWGNPIRYSVIVTAASGTPAFADYTSIQTFFNSASSTLTDANMFSICSDNGCTDELYNTIPAVVMSLGPNGSTYTSADEALNAGSQTMNGYSVKNDFDFVSTTFSEDNFDDQLIWLSPYILFNRMVSAGKLP